MNKLKITKEFVLLVVIATLLIINLLNLNTIKTDVERYENNIKNLQVNIDSIVRVNKDNNNKIILLDSDVKNITNKIEEVNKTINIVKRNTDEKIRNVNNFGVNDLELFFTNRYGKK